MLRNSLILLLILARFAFLLCVPIAVLSSGFCCGQRGIRVTPVRGRSGLLIIEIDMLLTPCFDGKTLDTTRICNET